MLNEPRANNEKFKNQKSYIDKLYYNTFIVEHVRNTRENTKTKTLYWYFKMVFYDSKLWEKIVKYDKLWEKLRNFDIFRHKTTKNRHKKHIKRGQKQYRC